MSVTATDLVQLPQVSAQAAMALGKQVLAAATGQTLPANAVTAHTKLTAAHAALGAALVDQFGAGTLDTPAEDSPAIQELDRILDNCWGGLDDRLGGLCRLPPGTPGVAEAAALRRRIFPGLSLAFLKLTYRLEWSESETRLQLIKREKLGPEIDRLAGPQFLPALKAAHKAYGDALGMNEPLAGVTATPQVRGAYDKFVVALRGYVLKVVASVEEDDADTREVADALLLPIERWTAMNKRAKAASTADPPAAAEQPAAEAPTAAITAASKDAASPGGSSSK